MRNSFSNRTIDEFQTDEERKPYDWGQHEHVGDIGSKEAQHLVHVAGSPELAKQAIDAIGSQQLMPLALKDELARDLGYPHYRQMMEQTEMVPLPTGSHMFLTTDSDGLWVAWSDKPFYDLQRFASRNEALSFLQMPNSLSIDS
jgi:hypothetical protein